MCNYSILFSNPVHHLGCQVIIWVNQPRIYRTDLSNYSSRSRDIPKGLFSIHNFYVQRLVRKMKPQIRTVLWSNITRSKLGKHSGRTRILSRLIKEDHSV